MVFVKISRKYKAAIKSGEKYPYNEPSPEEDEEINECITTLIGIIGKFKKTLVSSRSSRDSM